MKFLRSADELDDLLKKNGRTGSLIIQRGSQQINLRFRR